MSTKKIHNLIILDESGSMETIKRPTISGFNEVVQTIKGAKEQFPDQEHFISLYTFNSDGIKSKLYCVPVAELEELTSRMYQPSSMTPLLDAIGTSVTKLKYDLAEEENVNVLVTILTDGLENASKEYNGKQIKALIDELKNKGWTFTYIGANHDVEQMAMSISITNTLTFVADEPSTNNMWARERSSRMNYLDKIDKNLNVQDNYFEDDPKRD
jgi:hypothetical protein